MPGWSQGRRLPPPAPLVATPLQPTNQDARMINTFETRNHAPHPISKLSLTFSSTNQDKLSAENKKSKIIIKKQNNVKRNMQRFKL